MEVDETYIGGKEANKHASKKLNAGRGTVGKQAVMGLKQRGGTVKAMPIADTSAKTLVHNVAKNVEPGATVSTDEHAGYNNLGERYEHGTVKHSEVQPGAAAGDSAPANTAYGVAFPEAHRLLS